MLKFCVVALLAIGIMRCELMSSGDTASNEVSVDNYVIPTRDADWRPLVKTAQNGNSLEIEFNVFCRDFHKETPLANQGFASYASGTDAIENSVMELYESQELITAYVNNSVYLEDMKQAYNLFATKTQAAYNHIKAIKFNPSSGYNEVAHLLGVNEVSEKYLLDRVFQVALWIHRDGLALEELVDDSDETQVKNEMKLQLQSPSEEYNVNKAFASLESTALEYRQKIFVIANGILKLASVSNTNLGAQKVVVSDRTFISDSSTDYYSEPSSGVTETPQTPTGAMSLSEAKNSGYLDFNVTSTGGYNGRTMKLKVTSFTAEQVKVYVPAGFVFGSDAGGVANVADLNVTPSGLAFNKRSGVLAKFATVGNTIAAASVQSMTSGSSVEFTLNAPEARQVEQAVETEIEYQTCAPVQPQLGQHVDVTVKKSVAMGVQGFCDNLVNRIEQVTQLPWQVDAMGFYYRTFILDNVEYEIYFLNISMHPLTQDENERVQYEISILFIKAIELKKRRQIQEQLEFEQNQVIQEGEPEDSIVDEGCAISVLENVQFIGLENIAPMKVEYTTCVTTRNGYEFNRVTDIRVLE